ncbi:hypothetical protein A9Q84_05825 [Halobacteriovorax marinus]|uniref:Outer membrane protein beta-barrel domain-containing protein n=1 Tax=Halobacteriovorax marinus TaxID=97084 RepID=A0A1Y5FB71_9BACT|nr:hypothetical protein A9Q84_05825 [Halobacteriovorax marinus]
MNNFIVLSFLILSLFSSVKTFASEGDGYDFSWLDPDKEVFVLQNRKFRKSGRVHINAGGGITTSGAFVDAKAFQARVGYFFKEEYGFELVYSLNSGSENDTASSVRGVVGGSGSFPFRRIVDNYMGAMFLWSPFYTKINTFNKVVYMDWILGIGFAKLTETNNRNEIILNGDKTLTQETHTGIMWDIGAKFYVSERWSVKFDVTVVNYQALEAKDPGAQEKWYSNYDLTLAVGLNF